MMIGPSGLSITPTSSRSAVPLGPMSIVKPVVEVFGKYRVVESMQHVVVGDAVFACIRRNQRLIHESKLAWMSSCCKVTCTLSGRPGVTVGAECP